MHKYKLTIAYDGTLFSGWQVQPDTTTIQDLLQDKLKIILREPVSITGAGRTDAGVHALGQVAHFKTSTPLDLWVFRASMNGLLPKEIRILEVEKVPLDFHARYSATKKIYHYHLNLHPVQDPFQRLYSWNITNLLNLDNLNKAIQHLLGTHDFTSFANESSKGAASKNPVRTIDRIDIIPERTGIRLEFEGKSFLYKMVRNLTGILVEVAKGKRSPSEVAQILEAKDRRQAGRAAPAKGLFLIKVDYPPNPLKSESESLPAQEIQEVPDNQPPK